MSLSYLRSVMVGESKAYGFTIAFWGSGIILVDFLGMPGLTEALLFGFGAVMGFGLLAIFAFRGNLMEESPTNLLVFSSVHYLSALFPVAVSYLIVQYVASTAAAFFLAGMNVSVFYNLLMVVEKMFADKGIAIERKIESFF